MIKIVDPTQISKLKDDSLFFVKRENHVFGLFKQVKGKSKLVSKSIISLDLSVLPEGINDDLIVSTLIFKYRRDSRKAFLKIKETDGFLKFFFLFFEDKNITKLEDSIFFDPTVRSELSNLRNTNPHFLSSNGVISLIKGLIPKTILKYIRKLGILFIDVDDNLDFLPLEILCSEFDIVINRILPSRSPAFNKLNTLGIFSCSWNENFEFTTLESTEVFKDAKNYFPKVDLISHKMNLTQLISFMNNDVVYFSSHADKEGIDLGEVKLNSSIANLIGDVPKVIIFNNCYFDGFVDMIKVFVSKGTNCIISPFSKIPDSHFTKSFIKNFFYVFSRSLDPNLSTFVSSKISKYKNLYNHLLYRVYITSKED